MKKKNTWTYKHFSNYVAWQALILAKMCVHFLELPCLKCNENAVLLFKNTPTEEKLSFLFETNILYYVWWLPLFSK